MLNLALIQHIKIYRNNTISHSSHCNSLKPKQKPKLKSPQNNIYPAFQTKLYLGLYEYKNNGRIDVSAKSRGEGGGGEPTRTKPHATIESVILC